MGPNHLSDEPLVEGPPIPITIDVVKRAVSQIKGGGSTGPIRLNREMREATLPPTLIAKTDHPGSVADISRPLIRSLRYEF